MLTDSNELLELILTVHFGNLLKSVDEEGVVDVDKDVGVDVYEDVDLDYVF